MATISPTIPASGQSRATEELDVSSALTTITNAINGNLDDANLDEANITGFLKLFVAADRKVAFGTLVDPGGYGSVVVGNRSIPHGMGSSPAWAIVWSTTGITTGDTEDVLNVSLRTKDATNLNVRIRTGSGGTMNNPGNTLYWLAIV